MGVDVVDVHHDPTRCRTHFRWCRKVVFGRYRVQPYPPIAGADLAVNDGSGGTASDPTRGEPENVNQEVVGGGYVLVDHNGDDVEESHIATVRPPCPSCLEQMSAGLELPRGPSRQSVKVPGEMGLVGVAGLGGDVGKRDSLRHTTGRLLEPEDPCQSLRR